MSEFLKRKQGILKLASFLAVILLFLQNFLLTKQGFRKALVPTKVSVENEYNVNRTDTEFQRDANSTGVDEPAASKRVDYENHVQPDTSPSSPQVPSRTPTTAEVSEDAEDGDCIRRCANRKNRIYASIGFAGMSDRASIVVMVSKLAGYLCAVVDLPAPMSSFARSHNLGKKIREEVTWGDFFNLTFRQDGSQSLYDIRDNPNRSFTDNTTRHKRGALLRFYNRSKYPPDWTLLISNKSSNLLHDFEQLQRHSWEHEYDADRGFLWEIHRVLYKSDLRKVDRLPGLNDTEAKQLLRPEQTYHDRMRPSLLTKVPACQYASQTPEEMEPAPLHSFRTELRRRVRALAPGGTSTIFGFFHIRRGDSKKVCNTTLPDLESYLKCSLNGTESTGKTITLLMGSDERNAKYRQQVLDLVNNSSNAALPSYPHVSMLDADAITKELMEDLVAQKAMPEWLSSNHYQFLLLQGIGMLGAFNFSSFYLSKRRSDCRPCNHLLTAHPELWN
ncbi:unnamed protein product [Cylindrotheca closterium]|uniref:Uncharacterized protein n=1 Tax=Cylindrotheca closterium TaxID=2856 RepID=A0AAD2PV52_9STRA|nr:unnamed protein product [Cylindrotheca closterium]